MAQLTVRVIKTLPPNGFKYDTGGGGLAVRRRKNGPPKFVVKWRDGGRVHYATIGPYGKPWTIETARFEAARIRTESGPLGRSVKIMAAKIISECRLSEVDLMDVVRLLLRENAKQAIAR